MSLREMFTEDDYRRIDKDTLKKLIETEESLKVKDEDALKFMKELLER